MDNSPILVSPLKMINMEMVTFTTATFQLNPEEIFPPAVLDIVVFYYCSSFETLGNVAVRNCPLKRYNNKIDSIKSEQRMPSELHFFQASHPYLGSLLFPALFFFFINVPLSLSGQIY